MEKENLFSKVKNVLMRKISLNSLHNCFWDYFLYDNNKDLIVTYYGEPIGEIRFYRGIKDEKTIISRAREARKRAREKSIQE